ncbi:hypothetical protein [Streptomyces cadmiisoli]|uniref:hypothetical protein n=1 Tax=Streptomyces cadmiisoli TaxID=2184053 RepID=UPI0036640276
MEGDPAERRFVAAYRTGDRVAGVLSVGMPGRTVRVRRQAVAAGVSRRESVSAPGFREAVPGAGPVRPDRGGAAGPVPHLWPGLPEPQIT